MSDEITVIAKAKGVYRNRGDLFTIEEIDESEFNQWGYPVNPWTFVGFIDGKSYYTVDWSLV